ncbi:GGDEF domain-containing protein [Campylobacter hyointestinalis]|nr:GGDEF domain-containing protein [Campylobacter hyointestinalis]RAZ48674.1 GGDEF domain-containing protein [Campylobacter hyointestinalis subsp. lawsonii]
MNQNNRDNIIKNLQKIIDVFCIMSVVHTLVFFIRAQYDLMILSVFNIFVYMICLYLFRKESINNAFLLLHIQIMIYISICIIKLGWNCGFDLIFIALLSIVYINVFKSIFISYLVASLESVTYVLLYIFTFEERSFHDTHLFLINFAFLIFLMPLLSKTLRIIDIVHFYKLQNEENKFKNMSQTDYLTGLLNKRALTSIINETRYFDMIVAICDIDNFKKINDKYGHNVGDEILKHISEILTQNSAKNDIVSRWGGEEFFIVSFDTKKEIFLDKIEKMRRQAEKIRVNTPNGVVKCTLTFGVSDRSDDKETLIKQADARLYKGKRSTKNCVVSSDDGSTPPPFISLMDKFRL